MLPELLIADVELLLGSHEHAILLNGVFVGGQQERKDLLRLGLNPVAATRKIDDEAALEVRNGSGGLVKQRGLNAIEEELRIVRLGEVVIRLGSKSLENMFRVRERGEENDGNGPGLGLALESVAHAIAIEFRHVDVTDDQVRPVRGDCAQGFAAIFDDPNLMAVLLEQHFQGKRLGHAVLGHEDGGGLRQGASAWGVRDVLVLHSHSATALAVKVEGKIEAFLPGDAGFIA